MFCVTARYSFTSRLSHKAVRKNLCGARCDGLTGAGAPLLTPDWSCVRWHLPEVEYWYGYAVLT
jgi:hypothetical protein